MATQTTTDIRPGATPADARQAGFRHYRRFVSQLSLAGEVAVGLFCLWLAVELRSFLPAARRPMNPLTIGTCIVLLLLAVAFVAISCGANPRARGRTAFGSVFVATAIVLAVLFVFRSYGNAVSRPTVLFFSVLAAVGIGAWDQVSEFSLSRNANQRPRFVILVGQPTRVESLAAHLSSGPWRIAATLDDPSPGRDALEAKLTQLRQVVRDRPVDEVLLAASVLDSRPEAAEFYRGVIDLCEQTGLKLHVLSDWLTDYRQVQVDHLSDQPVLSFSFSPSSPWALSAKRAIDVFVSASLLLLSWPLLFLVAIAVRFDSPGPALFTQTRCGLRGRTFRLIKFRSMVANAETLRAQLASSNEMSGPVFKMNRDPRVTRLGRLLRKTSLDELPQLWNVLRGDMSLVGPRPPLPAEVQQYHLGSLRRLAMKPGMTGLWQVSGRNEIRDFEAWVRLDAYYIRHWSLLGDLKILLRTFGAVARMNGK